MKLLVWLLILAGLFFGGKWLYDNGYVDEMVQKYENSSFNESMNNTISRTSDFVTDKAVKEANF